jgi:hypothetical protein
MFGACLPASQRHGKYIPLTEAPGVLAVTIQGDPKARTRCAAEHRFADRYRRG